jgi:hypothetical protein
LFDGRIVNGSVHGVNVGVLSLEGVVSGRRVGEIVGTTLVGEVDRILELTGYSVAADNGASVRPLGIGLSDEKGTLVAGDDDVDEVITTVG